MKAMTIPINPRHIETIPAAEGFFVRDFCWHDEQEGYIDDRYFLHVLMSPLSAPTWFFRVPEPESERNDLANTYESIGNEVDRFLTKNAFLVKVLNESVPTLQKHFGDEVKVQLEIFSDPDKTTEQELFARVLTRLSAAEALDLLDLFDEDWWLDASPDAKCLLNFGLRYI